LRQLGEYEGIAIGSIDISTDQITLSGASTLAPRYAGRPLKVAAAGPNIASPLSDGQTVYMIPVDTTHIRIAIDRRSAEAGTFIDIGSTGSDGFLLESMEITQDEVLNATTGTVVRLVTASGSGALPTGLSTGTDYYLIRRGRGIFQVASTLQNALDGTNVTITDRGTDPNLTYKVTLKRERRFTINGAFDTDQDKRDVLKGFSNSIGMGALLEPLGTGKWRIKSGTYRLPTGSLGLAHIRAGGVPEVTTRTERQSIANTIKGVYNSPLNFDQTSDFPAISDPRYVAQDDGEELVEDITLPFTNSKTMARRIATSWLKRKRLQRTIRWPATLAAGFRNEYGDTVCVTLPLLSYTNKVFRVEGWEMSTAGDGGGPPIPRVDLILREVNPQAFQ
jgi:hypothetical protein